MKKQTQDKQGELLAVLVWGLVIILIVGITVDILVPLVLAPVIMGIIAYFNLKLK